jgi:hypothetical protein
MPNSPYDTVTGYGSVTNPGAAGIIASVTVAATGYYKIDCVVVTSGTTASSDSDNFGLNVPGNPQIVLMGTQGTGALSGTTQQFFAYITAGSVVTITAIGAASGVAAVYRARLSVTPWPREENTVGRLA